MQPNNAPTSRRDARPTPTRPVPKQFDADGWVMREQETWAPGACPNGPVQRAPERLR